MPSLATGGGPARHAAYPQLKRRRLGVLHLVFFTVAASAPLTVLGGGVTTMFAVTGIPGAPLSFLVIAAALGLFAVGYAAMSRHLGNAGAFYSYLANGLGPTWGVAASFVALVGYNAIQIGLYGLFGIGLGEFMAGMFGIETAWWIWALLALGAVGLLGVARIDLNAQVLAVLLVLECVVVAVYDVVAFTHPAGGGVSMAGVTPSELLVPGVGAVFAFGVASFIGFESGAIYSEECVNPRRTVARATYVSLAFVGLFYALSAWAMTVQVGPQNLQAAATEAGPGLVFGALADYAGPLVADVANVLFVTSVFAALLSFHNGVSRYLFALGRERVLPAALGRVGMRSGGPVVGSLTQSALALAVVVVFAAAGGEPLLQLFTWGSGIAAVGVILLMAGMSVSVVGYFARHETDEQLWQRAVAPGLAAVVLAALVALLVVNFDALLGADSVLRWILPGLVLAGAVIGACWGVTLRVTRPDVYSGIGRSAVPVTSDDEGLVLPRLRR